MAKARNYFIFQGRRYYAGTIVRIKHVKENHKEYGKYEGVNDLFLEVDITGNPGDRKTETILKEEDIESVVHSVDKPTYVKKYKDTDCSDMFYAWIVYIACMIFFTLTYQRVLWWILITAMFIGYRRSKLYVEQK